MLYVLNSMERMFDPNGRNDVGTMFFRHCTKMQDIFIELVNAQISITCPLTSKTSVETIADAAVLTAVEMNECGNMRLRSSVE